MKFALALVAILAVTAPAFGRTYDRCSLVRALRGVGVPSSELATWACIAEHESSYRTHVVGPTNADGSHDYGLFQINDRYWCQSSNGQYSHNGCGLSCNSLLSDKIGLSVACARYIKRQQGWTAWSVYKPKCSGRVTSIDYCF